MASYLFIDVNTLLARLRQRGVSIDLYELGTGLRSGATLAAGLASASDLIAVAVAERQSRAGGTKGGEARRPRHGG